MAEQRRITRKPLPPGAKYDALLTRSASNNRNNRESKRSEQTLQLPGSGDSRSAARSGFAGSQRSSHENGTLNQQQFEAQRSAKIPMLSEIPEHAGENVGLVQRLQKTSIFHSNGPLWLGLPFLFLFSVLIVAIIVTLTTLYHFAKQDQGFRVDANNSVYPYSWRYGPVAIFTIVAALWHQTDYHCKVAIPWLNMQHRATPGMQSLLLDYVSPWLPVAMYDAARNRDWIILASSGAYILLKVIIVVSTGLFAVQSTVLQLHNQSFPLLWSLNHIDYNNSFYPGAIDAYWGIVNASLQYAQGTNAFAAFQTFSTNESFPHNASVSAEVHAIFPTMHCEVAQSSSIAVNSFQSWTDGCRTGNYSLQFCVNGQTECTTISSRSLSDDSDTTLSAIMLPFTCGESSGVVNETTSDIRYLLALAEAYNVTNYGPGSAKVLTSLFCYPDYSIERARLDFDTTNPVTSSSFRLSKALTASGDVMEAVSAARLAWMISYLLNSASSEIPDPSWTNVQKSDIFFSLMLATESKTDLSYFRDSNQMAKTAQTVYQGLAIQMANQWLLPNLSLSTTGTVTYPQQRLFIQLSSLWVTCIMLALVLLCTFTIGVINRKSYAHKSFGEHTWNAYVLCVSGDVRQQLKSVNLISDRTLQEFFSRLPFKARRDGKSALKIETLASSGGLKEAGVEPIRKPWIPLGTRKSFSIYAVALMIALIGALEAVQQRSGRTGFASLTMSYATAHVLSTYIPAAILLASAAVLGASEFAVKVVAPFQCMDGTGVSAQSSISFSAFHLTPFVLYQSIRRRKYAVFLAGCTGLLASLFTIISAGLYKISYVPTVLETTFMTSGSFDLRQDAAGSLDADLLVSLLEYYNATYPVGTFKDLVYPEIDLRSSDPKAQSLLNQPSVSVIVHSNVLRPTLKCNEIPPDELSVSRDNTSEIVDVTTIGKIPDQCQKERLNGTTQFRTSPETAFRILPGATSYGGSFLGIDPYDPNNPNEWGSNNPNFADGCQSVGFSWGSWSNTSFDASNFTMYTCLQVVELVPAILTYLVPGNNLDLDHPPILDESKAQTVSTYQFPTGYLGTYGLAAPFDCDIDCIDPFFTAMVCGEGSNITKFDLANAAKRSEVLEAAINVYALIVAQGINTYMRTSSDPANLGLPAQVDGTIQTNVISFHIFQDNTSKIILQALLAASLLCFIGSYLLTDVKQLPCNPMTIAGSMSLLAGSKLCNETQDRDETFEEFKKRLQGETFRFGWWLSMDGSNWFGLDYMQDVDGSWVEVVEDG